VRRPRPRRPDLSIPDLAIPDLSIPDLSIIVVTYDMRREAPRTITSLSAPYQRHVDPGRWEVVVVDNGSTEPLDGAAVESLGPNVRYHHLADASPSPAGAVNRALQWARGRYVGVCLDGARMVTPGLVHHALLGLELLDRPVVATLAWHLGPDHQSRSIPAGYDRTVEDALLDSIGWPADGYRLFEIAALAGSNGDGWFGPVAESCCLFLPRALVDELGGWDERYDLPGGGYLNLDTFVRACELPRTQLVMLLGEGSFHQVHGGTSSNSPVDHTEEYHAQYLRIRGRPFAAPTNPRTYLGTMPPAALRFLR
jgi:glycosyltransferase involved in cell wall biosynthesis